MAILESSGTQTATLTTEHTLATLTGSKMYQAFVDCAALVSDEIVTIRVKMKCLTGGTSRTVQQITYNAQDAVVNPLIAMAPFLSDIEYVVTLEQNNGTGRAFPWKVLSP